MPPFAWKPGERSSLTVDGAELEAICHGPPPGCAPTIVMLHEGLGCVELWREFPSILSEATGYGVFAWSRAGYGRSDPVRLPRPIDYMEREATIGLPLVLEAIGFEYGILLGHSDGASIAAIYAGSVEDFRIRGLVLIAPHFFTEPQGLESIRHARTAYDEGSLKPRLAKYHADVDNAFCGWNDAWLDPRFADWNIADVIDYIRIPVLAIQGEDDEYGTIDQIDVLENRLYSPFERLILKNCRHAPQVEQPEVTLRTIVDFCTRLNRIEKAVVKLK